MHSITRDGATLQIGHCIVVFFAPASFLVPWLLFSMAAFLAAFFCCACSLAWPRTMKRKWWRSAAGLRAPFVHSRADFDPDQHFTLLVSLPPPSASCVLSLLSLAASRCDFELQPTRGPVVVLLAQPARAQYADSVSGLAVNEVC
jgi:hypothetical protein